MIEFYQHIFFYQVAQYFHIKHVTGLFIWLADNTYYNFVVMSVIVGITAFPKNQFVLFVRPTRIEQAMRCIEMFSSGNLYLHLSKVNRIGNKRFMIRQRNSVLIRIKRPI